MYSESLLALRDVLEKRLEYLEVTNDKLHKNMQEVGLLRFKDNADIVAMQSQMSLNNSVLERNQQEIKEILASLAKFESGIYGICEMCEGEIGIERLQSKPHTRFCIDCREIYEKSEKQKER